MEYTSYSAEDTKQIASSFAEHLRSGDVICLYGDLGAGKTAFVQGLAAGLHVKDYVTSPTFTIVNEHMGDIMLYHFDVYRIDDEDEMYEIGYDEYINGDGICVIEWPEKIAGILPEKRYEISIFKDYKKSDDYRLIKIDKRGLE